VQRAQPGEASYVSRAITKTRDMGEEASYLSPFLPQRLELWKCPEPWERTEHFEHQQQGRLHPLSSHTIHYGTALGTP